MLKYEAAIYSHLKGLDGFAHVYWFGYEGDFRVLVLEMLGPNL